MLAYKLSPEEPKTAFSGVFCRLFRQKSGQVTGKVKRFSPRWCYNPASYSNASDR